MSAYYNEIDPNAAAWLRELIKHNLIAAGDVDERSIEDVTPADLMGYDQCHFFAGIGIWSHALRLSGLPDDFKVWTGSCPCQPFSAAGKGKGFADERHLWPAFGWLIQQCRPERVFGEQVAGKDGLAWIDLVSADMEALGYAVGAVPFAAAGVGAPHIRERLYWVADANDARLEGRGQPERQRAAKRASWAGLLAGGMADADGRHAGSEREQRSGEQRQQPQDGGFGRNSAACAAHSFWSDADWLGCRDAKWRQVEPGTFPLAHGAAARMGRLRNTSIQEHAPEAGEARVMRLRGYGNGLVAQQAQAFIESYIEVRASQ